MVSLVDLARQAPTASNLQAWEFVLVSEPAAVGALASLAPGIAAGAEAIVAVCIDRQRCLAKAGAGGELFGLMDACFAAENLLLAATDAGLGACVIRSFHQDSARRALVAPDHVVPELLVTLGYPEGQLPRGPRRRDLGGIVHLGRWGRRLADERAIPAESATPPESDGGAVAVAEAAAPQAAAPEAGGSEAAVSPLATALRRFLSYLASSAHGLLTEPQSYGPYRLADSMSRLIAVMQEQGLADPTLLQARDLVEAGKLAVVDDTDRFSRMVGEVLRLLSG